MRDRAAAGADVVKIFASKSIRLGGVTDMSAEQLEAACGEALRLGLRSVVHTHRADGVRLAAAAGCTQIEHGWMLGPDALREIAASRMCFGSQFDRLFRNYAENASR